MLKPQAAKPAFTVPLPMGTAGSLANTGLISTDIAGLGINSNGHIFAATRSIIGDGGGMFRSSDDDDSWTEQNNGFTAFDAQRGNI